MNFETLWQQRLKSILHLTVIPTTLDGDSYDT